MDANEKKRVQKYINRMVQKGIAQGMAQQVTVQQPAYIPQQVAPPPKKESFGMKLLSIPFKAMEAGIKGSSKALKGVGGKVAEGIADPHINVLSEGTRYSFAQDKKGNFLLIDNFEDDKVLISSRHRDKVENRFQIMEKSLGGNTIVNK